MVIKADLYTAGGRLCQLNVPSGRLRGDKGFKRVSAGEPSRGVYLVAACSRRA
jgi:hypothetical protein